jgi:starch-binding outer membrane protein, SusD/RagB family
MKKLYFTYILIFLVALTLLSGCNKDYLDSVPLDRVSSSAVFSDEKYVEAYLSTIYNYLPNGYGDMSTGQYGSATEPYQNVGYGGISLLDQTTDIIVNKSGWPFGWVINNSGMKPEDNGFDCWASSYKCIFYCNDLLTGLANGTLPEDFKTKIGAEVRFNRAFKYFDLIRRYGDVPFFTELQKLEDTTTIFVPRTDKELIYDFIDDELTAAAEILPWAKDAPASYLGRATKEACIALNGRAMLFAERYPRSAELNKVIIDAVNAGTSDRVLSPDYRKLFVSQGGDKEVILEVLFNGAERGGSVDVLNVPSKYHGNWGGQSDPTQNMVDSYEMTNGKMPFEAGSGYDPQNPYANRDSRLEASILHHGSHFMDYNLDLTWELIDGTWQPKATNVDAPFATGLSTITGYYLRKFMDETAPRGISEGQSKQSWKEIRLAEVYLNYAEAQFMINPDDASILTVINLVRARAGQPDLTAVTMDKILNERKVEFFYEGDRYWVIRRHKLGNLIFNPDPGNPGTYMNCCWVFKYGDGSLKYIYNASDVPEPMRYPPNTSTRARHNWWDKEYLYPIPQDEINKNHQLVQNPGYGS